MTTDTKDLLRDALDNYDIGFDRERRNIDEAYEDQQFRKGGRAQWSEGIIREREAEGRFWFTINQLPQFIRQVTGDMRQMRPAIKVFPVDERGDLQTAERLNGMIRYIENRSFARRVYTTASDMQVSAGIAAWEITTEYAAETTFEQEARISPIRDGIGVIWDPDAILPTKEDGMWCHVPHDYTRKAFERKWPGKTPSDVDGRHRTAGWYTDDHVRVSKYWYKKPVKRTLALLPDGSIDDLTDEPEEVIAMAQAIGARVEKRDGHQVCWAVMTCTDILDGPEVWPGPDIPIVPLIGEEVQIGRETYRHGLVRYAKDPQRRYNAMVSAEIEAIALQPKAPFMATEKQVQDHMDLWTQVNRKNLPVLLYTPDPQAPGMPQRVAPAVSSQGIADGIERANLDMRRVTGIYDASLGARSNETSGRAILARQREGDVGTFVYMDNFSLAIQRTGQILVRLIPHIYDTARTIRIVGEDGKLQTAEINKRVIMNGQEIVQNDVTVAAYDVTVDVGPSFSTRREEARDGMQEFIRAAPAAAALIGDLYAKAQEWPNADEIAERLEEALPEPIKQKIAAKKQQAGEAPLEQAPQVPPDPMQQMVQHMHLRQAAAETAKTEAEAQRAQAEAELKRIQADTEATKAMLGLQQVQQSAMTPEQVHAVVMQALAPLAHAVDMIAGAIIPPMQQSQEMPGEGPMQQ